MVSEGKFEVYTNGIGLATEEAFFSFPNFSLFHIIRSACTYEKSEGEREREKERERIEISIQSCVD